MSHLFSNLPRIHLLYGPTIAYASVSILLLTRESSSTLSLLFSPPHQALPKRRSYHSVLSSNKNTTPVLAHGNNPSEAFGREKLILNVEC